MEALAAALAKAEREAAGGVSTIKYMQARGAAGGSQARACLNRKDGRAFRMRNSGVWYQK